MILKFCRDFEPREFHRSQHHAVGVAACRILAIRVRLTNGPLLLNKLATPLAERERYSGFGAVVFDCLSLRWSLQRDRVKGSPFVATLVFEVQGNENKVGGVSKASSQNASSDPTEAKFTLASTESTGKPEKPATTNRISHGV